MARVFLSSTFQDLREYRDAVYVALRRLGHESLAIEQWSASELAPLERSLDDLRASDVAIFLIGWRYGYVPADQRYSITELEFRAAREADIPSLVFLLSEDNPWPPALVDRDPANIQRFRRELREQRLVDVFTTPQDLATKVAIALHVWVANGEGEIAPPASSLVTEQSPGPEVFLSYAHEDLNFAQSISERISDERWSVFWDRTIPVGFTWDDIVEGALDAAKCVVVLWSPAARESEWVRIEATEGADRKILVPAMIEPTVIPLRFRRIQTADLKGWKPGVSDTSGMSALIAAVRRCVDSP